MKVGFGFHNNGFFVPILILKNKPNKIMNGNGIDIRFSISTFQTWLNINGKRSFQFGGWVCFFHFDLLVVAIDERELQG